MTAHSPRRDILRWSAALAVVLGVHAAGLSALQNWVHEHPPEPLPTEAMLLDLPPPAPPPESPKPEPPKPPPPKPEPAPPQPAPPQPAPPPPPPKPVVPRKIEPQPKSAPSDAVPMPREPEPPPPPPQAAKPVTPGQVTWSGQVRARIERLKRYPRAALLHRDQGVVVLHFVIDREGNVLTADIVRSSGVASIDEEALLLARRISPLPPPPPEMAGAQIELNVPIKFELNGF